MCFWQNLALCSVARLQFDLFHSSIILGSFSILLFPKLCWHIGLTPNKDRPALAIFDSFKGQTTPDIISILQSHNIIAVQVPANCNDKLQPLDVSLNKPVKDEMKKKVSNVVF